MSATSVTRRLPPAATEPIAVEETLIPAMGLRSDRAAAEALRSALAERPVLWVVQTDTPVDTGEWFRSRPAWLLALSNALLVFAGNPRSTRLFAWVEEIPFAAITAAVYNQVTGDLVVTIQREFVIFDHAAVRGRDRFGLRLPPVEAYQAISQIHSITRIVHA